MSSFRRRNVRKPIYGTRTSSQTGQVITSTGNPSLDIILGGGLPIGSMCLIEEDKYVTHARVLAKYFLVEGLLSSQYVFLGSVDDDPVKLMRSLPSPILDWPNKQRKEAVQTENSLRIAWRYGDLPLINSELTEPEIGHQFNLDKPIAAVFLEHCIILWDGSGKNPQIHIKDEEKNLQEYIVNGQKVAASEGGLTTMPTAADAALPGQSSGDSSHSDGDDDADADVAMEAQNSANEPQLPSLKSYLKTQPTSSDLTACTDDDVTNPNSIDNADEQNADNAQNNNNNNVDNNTLELENNDNGNNNNSNQYSNKRSPCTPPSISTASPSTTPAQSPSSQQDVKIFENIYYAPLLQNILRHLQGEIFAKDARRNLLRVCITSFGSPLWYSNRYAEDILKFLTVLRAAVRDASAVCFITMPMHLIRKYDDTLVPKIRNLFDFSIELDAFEGSDRGTHPVYRGYSGLLHLRKVTAINTLMSYMPETTDLAFKLRRKRFVIEKLHLQPELQDDMPENERPTVGCSVTNTKGTLDF